MGLDWTEAAALMAVHTLGRAQVLGGFSAVRLGVLGFMEFNLGFRV